ncbi:unnamed protein product [Taenia asiatica]|uniref:DDE_Tnp_1_7 domain-containing protein n=1 Tax=Taenia asiatica TaxID=60517 RepID=A0A0R3VUS4_TAEAS|nr:unnamed protein product [Taenia asiatica]
MVEAETCFDSWTFPHSPVAVSVKPSFKKHKSTIGGKKEQRPQWVFDLLNRADDVEITSIQHYWGKSDKCDLVAVKNFCNGTAKMRIQIDESKLRTDQCPFIDLQARSESSTRCRIYRTSASNGQLNFIVFNRTRYTTSEVPD